MSSKNARRCLRVGFALGFALSPRVFAQTAPAAPAPTPARNDSKSIRGSGELGDLTPAQFEAKMRALHPMPIDFEEKLRLDHQLPPLGKSESGSESTPPPLGVSPPSNDNCATPTVVNIGTVSFDVTCATAQASDPTFPCGGGGVPFNSLWYRFIPSSSGNYQIDLCGSSYDTLLGIWTGPACGPYVNVACNDDFCGLQSLLTVTLTAGVTYRIEIDGFSNATGTGLLNISGPLPPINDTCSAATVLSGSGPFPITGSEFTSLATTDFNDPSQGCTGSQNSNSVWFTWTPSVSCAAAFETCTSSYDTVVSVFTDSCGAFGTEIACNDDSGSPNCPGTLQSGVTWAANAGATYLIEVTDFGSPGGGTLRWRLDCGTGPPPANDECATATVLPSGGPFPITCSQSTNNATTGGGDPLQGCSFGGPAQNSHSVWFRWTAPQSGPFELNTCGSDYDTVASVFSDSCNALFEIACNDDSGPASPCAGTLQSFLTFNATAGVAYTIEITSFGGGPGGNLQKSLGPAPPSPMDVEPNDTVGLANPAGCGQSKVGLLSPRDVDIDYWSFSLAQWSLVTIDVDVPDVLSSVNPFLSLVDPMGNPLRVNDDTIGINSQIIMNLPPGTWYAAVRSSTTNADPDPHPANDLYAIHIQCTPSDCPDPPVCTNDGGESDGHINLTRRTGCMYFPVCSPNTEVEISVDSPTLDPCVFLTDSMDNYIDFDDDDGDGANSNLCALLSTPGTYRIRVQDFGAATGTFAVKVRFVPASVGTEAEPNDTLATSNPLPAHGPLSGVLSSASDVDYYSFTVPGMVRRGVTLSARSCVGHDNYPGIATDLALRVFTGEGVFLGTVNRNQGPDADEFVQARVPPGTYYVAVFTPGPVGPGGAAYEISASVCNVFATLRSVGGSCICCDDPMSLALDFTNLTGFPLTVDLLLQIRFCGGFTCSLPVRSLTLPGCAHPPPGPCPQITVAVPRPLPNHDPTTLRQWLQAMGCPCPMTTTTVEFFLTVTANGLPEAMPSCTFQIIAPCPH
ncbi:MAG: PPC domain-containing protein [Planctomycetes bacterium]|nr:PPC domain-containing protein [Planctomycetota bacterium]